MSGYANPFVLLKFPELGEDVSVLMRNPQLLPQNVLTPRDVPLDEQGQPIDQADANEAMYEVFARVIVAWKVYDGSEAMPLEIAEDADPVALFESLSQDGDQPRLGAITTENVAKMPMRIIKSVMEEIAQVADPQ
ncbi:hypothetical protein AB0M92_19170 [Streptomyces sp. NPDC051582]|uniref:hypothetical protein n=1 Tax=Streptomyces sp. NPDC051582 TaxID=3155167 RepID=UPI00344604F4